MTICSGHYAPATLLAAVSSHLTHTMTGERHHYQPQVTGEKPKFTYVKGFAQVTRWRQGPDSYSGVTLGFQQGTGGHTESSEGWGQESLRRRAEPEPLTLKQRTLSEARLGKANLACPQKLQKLLRLEQVKLRSCRPTQGGVDSKWSGSQGEF